MNNLKKFFSKKKKSIFSLILALVLVLSFNYSPLSLLAGVLSSNAYKSTSVQNYYSNSSTSNESNFNTGDYPKSLKDYFTNSSNNFNIQKYYNDRYSDLLAKYVDECLKARTEKGTGETEYKILYTEFLTSVGHDTLLEYYTQNASTIKNKGQGESFKAYAEYFVSHEIKYQKTGEGEKTIFALFTYADNSHEYKTLFYNTLANHITSTQESVEDAVEVKNEKDEVIGQYRDGVADSDKFYEQSKSYGRVKTFIDTEIEKTVAIYTYDGKTQNKNVAGILADKAPASMSYYYKDNIYESRISLDHSYVMSELNGHTDKRNVYYLAPENIDISNQAAAADNPDGSKGITTMVYDDNGTIKANQQKYPLLYRPINDGEYGYIAGVITYYKYQSTPYETNEDVNTSDNTIKVFVRDEDYTVSDDEQATYDFMYLNVLTKAEYESVDFATNYVQLPVPNDGDNDIYFTNISTITPSSDSEQERFDNFVETFTDSSGNSLLYLKYKTTPNKIIYTTDDSFLSKDTWKNYQYKKYVEVITEEELKNNEEEYFKITNSSFSSYYISEDYPVYFKKVKANYETLTSVDYKTGEYETKKVANIPFEKATVATTAYETVSAGSNEKKIYAYIPEGTEANPNHPSLTPAQLEAAANNEYVKVPNEVAAELNKAAGLTTTYTYYYHHVTISNVNKIYIVVEDDKYEKEKDNEVYKNLNYNVIKKSAYNYSDYIAIAKEDANYNKNFALYYKYLSEDDLGGKNIYIKNAITGENALFVIDDSVGSTDKTTYRDGTRNFIPITTKEYEANYKFYSQVTETDTNYNLKYTLYYKYNALPQTNDERVIYKYSSSADKVYKTFYNTDTDFLASDYELILPTDPNYVEGTNLYYKKIRNVGTEQYTQNETKTTFSYTTTSAVSFTQNSYYVISFYVYTNGTYTYKVGQGETAETVPMQASFYLVDSKGYITDSKIEHISTNGKWQKHYLFVATDNLLASSIKLSLYMGDQNSILGSAADIKLADNTTPKYTMATGTVLFDDIRITKINQTDYNKKSIDNEEVLTLEKDADDKIIEPINYVDEYKNQIFATTVNERTNDTVEVWKGSNSENYTFEDMFNFDEMTTYFSGLKFDAADSVDGFTIPTDLWQMYISRDVSGQGNNYILDQYQSAYKNGKLEVSVIEEATIDKTSKDDDEEEEDDDGITTDKPTEETEDVPNIDSTFIKANKVLKLKNTSRQLTLGLISNYFEINQNEYYKLTVWIYSPDEEAKATLSVNSVLYTSTTLSQGSLLSAKANVSANMSEYTDKQTNEYGWIPITFYIEGNALHQQNCYLTLCADKNSTIYFDNISIEKITSSVYDTANSDSDSTTYCLSLTPSTSVISAGVTNGYFNNVTMSSNFNGTIDYTQPKTAESWTVSNSSTDVVAGVVPTSDVYTALTPNTDGNFFSVYNNKQNITNSLKGNVFAIYAPKTINHPLDENDNTPYNQKNIYSIYSTSISLSASTTYKLGFKFLKGHEFEGTMFANLYTSSVKAENLISTISMNSADMDANWNAYTFYVDTDASSATLYIEIGIKNAVGTCFFSEVSNVSTTQTIDELRDEILESSENVNGSGSDLYEKSSFDFVKFVELDAFEFSLHSDNKVNNAENINPSNNAITFTDETNVYETNEFTNDLANTSTFTRGNTGIAVANYYTSTKTSSYTVTINKVEYYIKSFTDETTGNVSYKMFSDSNYKDEVTKLDGKSVKVEGFDKVVVGLEEPTEYDIVEKQKTNYTYNFENDVTINNIFIDSDELKNDYSENVLILANSYETDFTLANPKYSTTLSKSSYYVVKVYAKTSSFKDGFGLNIDLDSSISRKWTNIDTTDAKYDELRDENGFVCYQILISTNASAISSFSIKFSIGTEKSTGSGYAIIAGIDVENFATEKLFKEYSLNYENVDKNSNDTVIKSYIGAAGTESKGEDTKKEEEPEEESSTWATFFYIFSSLLLGIVLVMALVAILIKKHPIKIVKQEQNEHDKQTAISTTSTTTRIKKKSNDSNDVIETQVETEEIVKKDDGFV